MPDKETIRQERIRADENLVDTLTKYDKYLLKILDPWKKIWQKVSNNIAPIRENMEGRNPDGYEVGLEIYDSKPIAIVQIFSNGMQGATISSNIVWQRLTMEVPTRPLVMRAHPGAISRGPMRPYLSRYETLEDVPEVLAWLQDSTKGLYDSFRRSNIYSESTSIFDDAGTIGTAHIFGQEDIGRGRLVFKCFHPATVKIATDQYGNVDTHFRTEKLSAKILKEKFGEDRLSNKIKQSLRNNPFEKHEVLHCIYPRTERIRGNINKKNKPVASVWIDPNSKKLLGISGFDMMHSFTWRYRTYHGDSYGRSPAMFALADIAGVHVIEEELLGAGQLAVRPAYAIPEYLKDKTDLGPGGENFIRKQDTITPIHTAANFPIGAEQKREKIETIKDHFHVDFFLMLASATRQMTATEILERQGERASLLGAATGRLQVDFLDPLIDLTFFLEYRAGRLPLAPDIVIEYAPDQRIGVDYLGPLPQIQKRLFRTQGITQGLAAIQPLAEMFPKLYGIFKPYEVGREILEVNNFPQRGMRTREEYDAWLQAQEAAAAKAEMRQQIMETLESAKTLAQADQATGNRISEGLLEAGGEQG